MLELYKNKNQEFSFKIKIEGASKYNSKPRLVLYPNNESKNIFFEGIIKDDICKIDIPSNLNISKKGKAVLEIIIDDSIIFKPWKTDYEIITEIFNSENNNVSIDNGGSIDEFFIYKMFLPKKQKIKKLKTEDKKYKKSIVKKNKSINYLIEEAENVIKDDNIF